MQRRVKQDLLQGLLEYPSPVYSQNSAAVNKAAEGKFFQVIPPAGGSARLSRRNLTGSTDRQASWKKLRKIKNI